MADRLSQVNATGNSGNSSTFSNDMGIVLDVILDESHPRITTTGDRGANIEAKTLGNIGSIAVRPMNSKNLTKDNAPLVRPIDMYNTDYPIVGEIVQLIDQGGVRFYKRVSSLNLNIGNAALDRDLKTYFKVENSDANKSATFKENNATGTPNASTNEQERSTDFGKYFTENKVNLLKPYEGDKIIQSRFGQSIRFSGYNNSENVFAPTIIIRNRQNDKSLTNGKKNSIVEEDVNEDGTIIAITSGNYKLGFASTTESKPNKFKGYPSELKGIDQLLVNSGRIIFSSKVGEMIFYSKGNYGFISDGTISIDNLNGGAELDFGSNVNITTDRNNAYFKINTGDGKIFLNTDTSGKSPNTSKPSEPFVRGNTLKELLETLIDLIKVQVYKTPSGPTAIGPENKPDFDELKRRLTEMLSTKNFTE